MKRITLTPAEKAELIAKGLLLAFKGLKPFRFPLSTIFYGKGTNQLWDKISREWIIGDTKEYIRKTKNVGRRGTEYKNSNSWYECEKDINSYGGIGNKLCNGIKNKITMEIMNVAIVERKSSDSKYKEGVIKLNLKLVPNK